MKYAFFLSALCILPAIQPAWGQIPDGFRPLFNGQDLSGWHGDNPHTTAKVKPDERQKAIANQQAEFLEHWRVENQELVNDGQGPYATTDQDYGDIELIMDYQTVALADSGIYLRGTPQVQIWDTTEAGGKWDRNADKGSGGLFNNSAGAPGQLPLMLADRPFGQWNRLRMVQIGARTWVDLNHQPVVDGAIMENYWDKDRRQALPAQGPIHLQTHGGEIRWKNIAVRSIGDAESIVRLRGDDARYGFESIFNGRDLSGWAGAVDDYEVIEGTLVCKPDRGGVLFTEQEYEDFVVRLEFKLPAGGNNGLAIRYPGQGRAAYDGMCELQVLDDAAEKYAALDPRQFHGSIYGIVPAQRGYLRPAGRWNYQEVTVKGSHIRVELNGTTIVDADTSQITEYKDDSPHPGLGLLKGHFGFAGHNDPVQFRNIAIKRLAKHNQPAPPAGLSQGLLDAAQAMILHASFDDATDLNLFGTDGRIFTADSTRRENPKPGNLIEAVSIAKGQGRYGDALAFHQKTDQVLFYQGSECGYRPQNWSGSVSLWMRLDPDRDLQPGYCDPIQITQRGWNDAAFFVDFDKDLPRDFRLGVFPDFGSWNPQDTPWDEIPTAERPMVTVKRPPFTADAWTHVCFTWENVNADDNRPATATLYLNGMKQGAVQRPLRFSWDPQQVGIMLGLSYIGLMDDLMIFNKALTAEQVASLHEHPLGGLQ